MAATAQGTALTQQHRIAQIAIRAAAASVVTRLWTTVDPTNLTGTYDRFVRLALPILEVGYQRSAATAAAYFTAFRTAEGVAAGGLTLVRPKPADSEKMADSLRGAGLTGIVNARRAGQSVAAASNNGLVKVIGETTRLTLAGGRGVLTSQIRADRRAAGWRRVTSASPCDFCRDIADGGVASKESAVDFETHGHCSCSAEPAYVQ